MPPRRSQRKKQQKQHGNAEVAIAEPSQKSHTEKAAKADTTKPTNPRRSKRNVSNVQATAPQPKSSEHELNEEIYDQLFDQVIINLEEDDNHIVASGVSVEAEHMSAFPAPTSSTNISPALYPCEHCDNVLTSKHGFAKHVMNHLIKKCNSKRPSAAALKPLMESFTIQSLNEIASEHGDEKKKFVEEVLSVSQSGSSEWTNFVSIITSPIMESVSKPSKMLPANQYEEQLISLNKLLNNEDKSSAFLAGLMNLSSALTNQNLAKMILFRLLSKVVDKTVNFVFSEMRVPQEQQNSNIQPLNFNSDSQEATAFYVHMSKLVQKYYIKGLKNGSKLWLARCASIRLCFVDGPEIDHSPSVEDIISNETWEENENGVVKVKLAPIILKYFSLLESSIEAMIVNGEPVNSDTVLNTLFSKNDKSEMLEIWHSLTSPYLSELESLIFMKDIVSVMCNLSLRLEVGRERDKSSNARIQKYALRTDLKRN